MINPSKYEYFPTRHPNSGVGGHLVSFINDENVEEEYLFHYGYPIVALGESPDVQGWHCYHSCYRNSNLAWTEELGWHLPKGVELIPCIDYAETLLNVNENPL